MCPSTSGGAGLVWSSFSPPLSLPLCSASLSLSVSAAVVEVRLRSEEMLADECWPTLRNRTLFWIIIISPVKEAMAVSSSLVGLYFWRSSSPVLLSISSYSQRLRRGSSSSPPPTLLVALLRLWDDGGPGFGYKFELCLWAFGAALLRGRQPSVQPAADPCAEEAPQHRGQAMGARAEQAAQTKGLQLMHTHACHRHTWALFCPCHPLLHSSLSLFHLFALPVFHTVFICIDSICKSVCQLWAHHSVLHSSLLIFNFSKTNRDGFWSIASYIFL